MLEWNVLAAWFERNRAVALYGRALAAIEDVAIEVK